MLTHLKTAPVMVREGVKKTEKSGQADRLGRYPPNVLESSQTCNPPRLLYTPRLLTHIKGTLYNHL